jgi:beta-glucosidase/6-phospho-beta-glucosidase/beta-galactosidase
LTTAIAGKAGVACAREAGIAVQGYFARSRLDNVEWKSRCGLIDGNVTTQTPGFRDFLHSRLRRLAAD